jgi:anti-anti-sigma regulatory factor
MYIRRHAFCGIVRIMEIRIDITSEGPDTVIHIAGRLSGVAIAQLSKACGAIQGAFVMDLSNLLYADNAGIDVIRTLEEKGAKVRGASQFVQLLLDDTAGYETNGGVG